MTTLMRAHVIIDTSSLAHAIALASARSRRNGRRVRIEPDVANLVAVLAGHGIDVTGVSATVASTPVWTGPESVVDIAVRIAARDTRWMAEQQVRSPVPLRALPGAENGRGEIGVDALVVAGALVEAERIRRDPGRAGEAVIVITHDSDMDHLPRYADPVPLVFAGAFDLRRQRSLRRGGAPFLLLEPGALLAIGGDGPLGAYPPAAIERPDQLAPPPDDAVYRPVTAIVDAYGIMCSAAAVLGVASLPSAASVRACLADLGWPADASVLAAVPDIPGWIIRQLPVADRAAWRDRDGELDKLADHLRADGDPTTVAARGVLRPDRVAASSSLGRAEFARLAKRLATQCAADLVAAVLHPDVDHVVLVSDLPDLAWLTGAVAALVGRAGSPVTRVGARAAPCLTIVGTDPRRTQTRPDAPFIVLPEAMLAQLVRINGPTAARAQRGALIDQLQAPDVAWTVVGAEPEVAGMRLRSEGDDPVEVALADVLALGLHIGEHLDLDRLPAGTTLELRFDPDTPGLAPALAVADHQVHLGIPEHGVAAYRIGAVDLVAQNPGTIDLDLDHDGRPDIRFTAGEELIGFRPGARAVLGQLANDDGTLVLLGLDETTRPATLEWVEVLPPSGAVLRCRPLDTATATTGTTAGELWPPPGAPGYTTRPGELVRAVRYGVDDLGHPRWIAALLAGPIRRLTDVVQHRTLIPTFSDVGSES